MVKAPWLVVQILSFPVADKAKALVAGSNLMLSPEVSLTLSKMSFLSPDSLCHSFDSRANGYARGEGTVVMVLKRLSDAIENRDTIRALLRSSGVNQDGHTPGITQPSSQSQEKLIRSVYRKAELGFDLTRYVEAHGKSFVCPAVTHMLSSLQEPAPLLVIPLRFRR